MSKSQCELCFQDLTTEDESISSNLLKFTVDSKHDLCGYLVAEYFERNSGGQEANCLRKTSLGLVLSPLFGLEDLRLHYQ